MNFGDNKRTNVVGILGLIMLGIKITLAILNGGNFDMGDLGTTALIPAAAFAAKDNNK